MQFAVRDIHKSFKDNHVLKGIGFSTESGKAFGLLGRNGAGKTTAIRIIMGVFPADSGQVLVDGAPIRHDALRIGYLPEERGLYPKIKIGEQLLYLARLRGMEKKEAGRAIAHWLERLGMEDTANRNLDTLSKGNQQKIQLAAALVNHPDILILDEPFSGLDPVNAALLKDVVKEQISAGKIVLFSSHQMNYVEEFCDDIAILHEGKIALAGSIAEIKRSYARDTLLVRARDMDAVQGFCAGLSGLVASVRPTREGLRVHLLEARFKPDVMQRLAASGIDLDSVGVYEPSLNDIFVQYAGDEPEGESA